jgi:hypothetical protein
MGNEFTTPNYIDLLDDDEWFLEHTQVNFRRYDSLFGFPYVESPEDSSDDYNVSPDFPPLGDCPPHLSLESEVLESSHQVSIFRANLQTMSCFIEFIKGMEKIIVGDNSQAKETLVDGFAILKKILNSLQS